MEIYVLISPGVKVPLSSLYVKEQNEVEQQMKLVSEVAKYEITEDDEWSM